MTLSTSSADADAEVEPDSHDRAVQHEARRIRIAEDARRLVANERAVRDFRVPPEWRTLTGALAEPDEEIQYRIAGLLPVGGNAVLTSPFKGGKTTTINNAVRCLADGAAFLGRFAVAKPTGRIAVFNYEVGAAQYKRWLRDAQVQNTDAISVLNLRGYRLPLTTPHGEDWVVAWLIEHDVSIWILDPYGRALAGADENSNSEVGAFLEALDVIKSRAGVGELIMPAHTGREKFEPGEEHARGATRIDDWPDARWLLSRAKDSSEDRFLRATGRDVAVEEELLVFDPATRHLTFGGWDRAGMALRRLDDELVPAIVEAVRAQPGMGVADLRSAVRGDNAEIGKAIKRATRDGGPVVVVSQGHRRAHYLRGLEPVT